MKLRTIMILIAGISIASTIVDVTAQGYPSGGGKRGAPPSEMPFAALERELPSLKVDMMVREDQLDDWRVFERDVRDLAEIERLRAEAASDLKRHAEGLYGRLDESQRHIFDRRAVQSQTD